MLAKLGQIDGVTTASVMIFVDDEMPVADRRAISEAITDPTLGIERHRTSSHAAALQMLQHRRADFLLDYQTPVEQARRRLGMAELPFVQLQRIPLKLIVSRRAPAAEALRDALDRAYAELSAAGEDLRLP